MKDVEKLRQQFEIIKDISDSENGFEEMEELEHEVEMEMIYIDDTRLESFKEFAKLKDEIRIFIDKNTKNKESHFNAEAELDRMYPDRHDEDFDEDSMSYDSAFGDD